MLHYFDLFSLSRALVFILRRKKFFILQDEWIRVSTGDPEAIRVGSKAWNKNDKTEYDMHDMRDNFFGCSKHNATLYIYALMGRS